MLIETIKRKSYIIIPFLCLTFYLCLLFYVYAFFSVDFINMKIYHPTFKNVLNNPRDIYMDLEGMFDYYYLPSFACFFSFLGLLDLFTASYIYLIILYISSLLIILLFDKILILLNLKNKWIRLLFLLIISNGWVIFNQFRELQTKIIVCLIFLYVIEREIDYRINDKEKKIGYYIINYGLFIFGLGITPNLIFLFVIYLFHEIRIDTLFKRINIAKYLIVISIFLIENFLFFIYPELIFKFLNGINFPAQYNSILSLCLSPFQISNEFLLNYIRLLLILITILITILLTVNSKLLIEWKFSIFCLSLLYLDIYKGYALLQILLPFVLLLLVPFIKQEVSIKKFVEENYIMLIGFLSASCFILISSDTNHLFRTFTLLQKFPFYLLIYFRWLIVTCLFTTILLILIYKNKNHFPYYKDFANMRDYQN